MWKNPKLKAKMQQNKGIVQVFYGGKKLPGCYCKVYQKRNQEIRFYRDGYTDITGVFKYALGDVQGITQFSILVMSENGGVIFYADPPTEQGYLR